MKTTESSPNHQDMLSVYLCKIPHASPNRSPSIIVKIRISVQQTLMEWPLCFLGLVHSSKMLSVSLWIRHVNKHFIGKSLLRTRGLVGFAALALLCVAQVSLVRLILSTRTRAGGGNDCKVTPTTTMGFWSMHKTTVLPGRTSKARHIEPCRKFRFTLTWDDFSWECPQYLATL